MKHLWEIDHPYYCNEGNYFAKDCIVFYTSWKEFMDSEGDSDEDMNLLFRWDWKTYTERGIKKDYLLLFWIGQRKGIFRSSNIIVKEKDETEIKIWLQRRYIHLKSLWKPFR